MAYPRILIIEDTRQTVDDLRDYFELEGYETEVALNSQVAVSIIAERKMSLALIGTEVHEVPAIEIIKGLRSVDPSLPIIVIYENKSKRTEAALTKAGAQDFIAKPLDKNIVLQKVKSILELKEAEHLPKEPSLPSKAIRRRVKKK
ncbi:MAG TPA: response regulator [Candidatus Brocadiia bacterium]|nr:response regulator [Planctomycetota bacterium]MBI4007974.1 response regulator [Planctomycetota bacterium]MDO8091934.1 response regulator [Candidatus Brocadiales bacterium]